MAELFIDSEFLSSGISDDQTKTLRKTLITLLPLYAPQTSREPWEQDRQNVERMSRGSKARKSYLVMHFKLFLLTDILAFVP